MEENSTGLRCPVCGETLVLEGRSVYCINRHCFDVARSGYVNLMLPNQKNSDVPGDNKEMTDARVSVMKKGYYKALADFICYYLRNENPEVVLDAGCGVGYITQRVKEEFEDSEVIGTDISKSAIEQASKKFKGPNYVVASSIRLPVNDEFCAALICAFAPVYASEFCRVLKNGGLFLRVVPSKKHLWELKEYLYETPRENEEEELYIDGFEFLDKVTITDEFTGDAETVTDVIKMTPYYYHTPKEKLEKLSEIDEFAFHTEFDVLIYKKI